MSPSRGCCWTRTLWRRGRRKFRVDGLESQKSKGPFTIYNPKSFSHHLAAWWPKRNTPRAPPRHLYDGSHFVVPSLLVTRGHQSLGRAQTHVLAKESKAQPFPRDIRESLRVRNVLEGATTPLWGERDCSDLQNLRSSCGWGPRQRRGSPISWTWSCATCGSGRTESPQPVPRAGAPPTLGRKAKTVSWEGTNRSQLFPSHPMEMWTRRPGACALPPSPAVPRCG